MRASKLGRFVSLASLLPIAYHFLSAAPASAAFLQPISLRGMLVLTATEVYIDPYHANGQNLARRVQITDYPAVGGVPIPGTDGDCTGTLIQSNIRRPGIDGPDWWVLTAGHCVGGPTAVANGQRSFRPRGRYEPDDALYSDGINLINPITSDRVRRHPDYDNDSLANDVALIRLSPTNMAQILSLEAAGTPRSLLRIPTADGPIAGRTLIAVGVGNANAVPALGGIPAWGGGYGDKRLMVSAVTDQNAGGNAYTFHSGLAPIGNNNPTRHLCPGDSGGPSFFHGTDGIGGVHSYVGPNADCNGGTTLNADANVTLPFLYNWIDSYTRRSVFWDMLSITTQSGAPLAGDQFNFNAADRGKSAVAPGWATWNNNSITHPTVGLIGPNDGWRHISAIGTLQNGDFELGSGSQSQGAIMTGGGASLLRKEFPVLVPNDGRITVSVQDHIRSLGLETDFGVCVVNTTDAQRRCIANTLTWFGLGPIGDEFIEGYQVRFQDLTLDNHTGNQILAVFLLNTPEPGTLSLLALPLILRFGRRAPRRS